MLQRSFSALILAALGLVVAGVATAQPGLSTKPDYDLIYKADRVDEYANLELENLRTQGVQALQAKNYGVAEKAFGDMLALNPKIADANFLMGITKISLDKWSEAKGYLEVATQQDPKRPEAKTRLGLTYIRLGDPASAAKQRAALASLDADCKHACPDAEWITDGLAQLDRALSSGGKIIDASSLAASDVRLTNSGSSAPAAAVPASSKDFDPASYSLVTFDDQENLYDLLTQPGRCPVGKTAEPRQPCALILYTPTDGNTEGLAANFKPIFKIESKTAIWAIHDKKLQKVKIQDLYFDEEQIIGNKRKAYASTALIGNAENTANCKQGLRCLSDLVTQDMFKMYSGMPDSVVIVIWPQGMKDNGTIRVR